MEFMQTLIERIRELMESDTDSPVKQSRYLAAVWEEANSQQRDALDEAFTALCGYTLTHLIEGGNEV